MTLGNSQAHKRLGELINELRKLEPHLGLPQQHAEIFHRAVNVLSEMEAEMGAQTVPAAEVAHSLQFSPDVAELAISLASEETARNSSFFFGPYFESLIRLFPQSAVAAARKFRLDPQGSVESLK